MRNIVIRYRPNNEGVLTPAYDIVETSDVWTGDDIAASIVTPKPVAGWTQTDNGAVSIPVAVALEREINGKNGRTTVSNTGILDANGEPIFAKTKRGLLGTKQSHIPQSEVEILAKNYKPINLRRVAKIAASVLLGLGVASTGIACAASSNHLDSYDVLFNNPDDGDVFSVEGAIKANAMEKYSSLSESAKIILRPIDRLSIDSSFNHSNTSADRPDLHNLRTDVNKMILGANYEIELAKDIYLIPGAEGTYRIVKYEGGNSPDKKFVDMPGARLQFINDNTGTKVYIRYKAGNGKYKFKKIEKNYDEAEFFAALDQQVSEHWAILAKHKRGASDYEDVTRSKTNHTRLGVALRHPEKYWFDEISVSGEHHRRNSTGEISRASNLVIGLEKELGKHVSAGFDLIIPLDNSEYNKGLGAFFGFEVKY